MTTIDRFRGDYGWLSNMFETLVVYRGEPYGSVEHAFQAAKCDRSNDRHVFQWRGFASSLSPVEAKRAGRKVSLRPDWEAAKLGVMRECVRSKFQHPDLRTRLLATGDADLVEGNEHGDTFWGVCRGKGRNWLGRILMEERAAIRVESVRLADQDESA